MKKTIATMMLALLPVLALADELAEAVKAWEQRDFARALAGFSKLANAGNAQAQQMLGEMYGFGDGVPEDPALARQWLQKAAAAGNQEAAASLQLVEQRGQRRADIARALDGGVAHGLTLAGAGCVAPRFPDVSTKQDEIRTLGQQVKDYRACYEKFVAGLAARKLPEDIASLMSLAELDRARAATDAALAKVTGSAQAEALRVIADNDAWIKRSRDYAEANKLVRKSESDRRQREIDDATMRARAARDAHAAGR